jgi:hypothetical protein
MTQWRLALAVAAALVAVSLPSAAAADALCASGSGSVCCHGLKFLKFTYTYSSTWVVTTAYWARRYRSDGSLAYNNHVTGNWAFDNTIDVWRETALALDASGTYPWDMKQYAHGSCT